MELFNGVYHVPEAYFLKELYSVREFINMYNTISMVGATEFYSKEKRRLQNKGIPMEDFDIMIGAIGVVNDMIVVTKNAKHFSRIDGIQLEDWTK